MINLVDQGQMIKQMADFQKTAFDGSLNAMEIYQNRMEKWIKSFWNHTEWAVEKWGGAVQDWNKVYQTGYESFQKATKQNFSSFSILDNLICKK